MNTKLLKLKVTNLYLVRAGDKYLLVDTGYEYEWKLFCVRLAEASVRLDEIGWVLLTHHHDDHSGLLNRIVTANPGVRIILSDLGKEYLAAGKYFHTPNAGYVNRRIGLLLSLKGRFDKKWTHAFPSYMVRENDLLVRGDTSSPKGVEPMELPAPPMAWMTLPPACLPRTQSPASPAPGQAPASSPPGRTDY